MLNETEYHLYERYNFISQQYTKYVGSCLYIMCLFGTVMNMLTFIQKTYNCRACSLYLLIASTCDFGHLHFGLLANILQYGFHFNWTINLILYCKINSYLVYVFTIISGTLTTLACIDRYMLSSEKSTRWDYSRRSVGIRCIKLTILFWSIMSIPILFCLKRSHRSLRYNELICLNTCQYRFCILIQIVYICLFNGFLPPFIMMIFSYLTYKNVHHLHQRSQTKSNSVRQVNEQLTSMFILQSLKSTFASIPYSIFNCYWIMTIQEHKSLIHQSIENLINQIVELLFWSNYTSFYIYIYSSDIFRDQWIKTMKKFIYCSWKKRSTSLSSTT